MDFGGWQSPVATRKNDDGTTSIVTTGGLALVVGTQGGKRTLVLRDMQHEYVFTEANRPQTTSWTSPLSSPPCVSPRSAALRRRQM